MNIGSGKIIDFHSENVNGETTTYKNKVVVDLSDFHGKTIVCDVPRATFHSTFSKNFTEDYVQIGSEVVVCYSEGSLVGKILSFYGDGHESFDITEEFHKGKLLSTRFFSNTIFKKVYRDGSKFFQSPGTRFFLGIPNSIFKLWIKQILVELTGIKFYITEGYNMFRMLYGTDVKYLVQYTLDLKNNVKLNFFINKSTSKEKYVVDTQLDGDDKWLTKFTDNIKIKILNSFWDYYLDKYKMEMTLHKKYFYIDDEKIEIKDQFGSKLLINENFIQLSKSGTGMEIDSNGNVTWQIGGNLSIKVDGDTTTTTGGNIYESSTQKNCDNSSFINKSSGVASILGSSALLTDSSNTVSPSALKATLDSHAEAEATPHIGNMGKPTKVKGLPLTLSMENSNGLKKQSKSAKKKNVKSIKF